MQDARLSDGWPIPYSTLIEIDDDGIESHMKIGAKVRTTIVIFAGIMLSSAALAETTCKAIGDDTEVNGNPSLIIDGQGGAFRYTATNGKLQTLSLKCDHLLDATMRPSGVICERVFKHDDGYTTEHYVIAKMMAYTTLSVSTFVESARFLDGENFGTLSEYSVSCETTQ